MPSKSAKKTIKKAPAAPESNNAYFLKILLYFIVGSIWIKHDGMMLVPVGLILGLLFASHDHFKIDRKIEYAVLIVATLVGLTTAGLTIVV